MSEIIDDTAYNFYDYVKSIYIYSHVKTRLIDYQRQPIEIITNGILTGLSFIFVFFSIFKFFVIIFYFIFIQALSAFIKFIISIFKTKFRISFYSSFINAILYLGKVFRRIYTFNFYLFHNKFIGFIMIFSYFLFLISSCVFYILNIYYIENIEKPLHYLVFFYFHFESIILIQLLCSSFYACNDMKITTIISIGLFITMNAMLFLGYCITDKIESVDGSFENHQPQKIMNIIFDTIFLFINGISLFKIIFYNKNSKLFIFTIILI